MGKSNSTPSFREIGREIGKDLKTFVRGRPQSRSEEAEEQHRRKEEARIGAQTAYDNDRHGRTPRLRRTNRKSAAKDKLLPLPPRVETYDVRAERGRRSSKKRPGSSSPIRRAPYDQKLGQSDQLPVPNFGGFYPFQSFQPQGIRRRNQSSSPIRRNLQDPGFGNSFSPPVSNWQGPEGLFPEGDIGVPQNGSSSRNQWESDIALDRIHSLLNQVKEQFPSVRFEKETRRLRSPEDVELVLTGVIQAYEDACWTAREWEDTIQQIESRYESLKIKSEDSLAENRGLAEQISRMASENERGQAQKRKLMDEISQAEMENERQQKHIHDLVADISRIRKENEQKQRENERTNGQLEGMLSAVRDQHSTQEQKHDDRIKKILKEHQSEKKSIHDEGELKVQRLKSDHSLARNRFENETKRLKAEHHEEMMSSARAANEELTRVRSDLQRLKAESEEKMSSSARAADAELTRVRRDFESRLIEAQRTLAATIERYDVQIERLENKHEEEKLQISSGFAVEEDRMKRDHIQQRNQILAAHQKEKRQLEEDLQFAEDDFHKQLGKMKVQLDQETAGRSKAIDEIKADYDSQKAKMRADHEVEKVALTRSLQESVEVLKGALVKRDHFKAMSDHELSYRFQEISSEVDDLSRIPWDKRQSLDWPFPDEWLQTSDNERRMKQYVIQNTLWVVLYEKIFCTPFRVLGREGTNLEVEWVKRYGPDQRSTGGLAPGPKPTKDSEKWRYETMKICVEATGQPLMEGEPNYKVKQAYELSVKEATEELSQELGRISLVTSGEKQRMGDLVRKAAKLWLEVGQQRYRMFLQMSHSGREPARSKVTALDRERRLDLVVLPELRRMGNAQGERLDKEELVMGCKGKYNQFTAPPQ